MHTFLLYLDLCPSLEDVVGCDSDAGSTQLRRKEEDGGRTPRTPETRTTLNKEGSQTLSPVPKSYP